MRYRSVMGRRLNGILCLASTMLASACLKPEAMAMDRDASCSLVLAHIVGRVGKIKSVSGVEDREIAVQFSNFGIPTREELVEFSNTPPSYADSETLPLIRQSVLLRDIDPLKECENVGLWLARTGLITDQSQISEITREEKWSATVISVAMPAFDANSGRGLIYASEDAGSMAGVSGIFLYRLETDESWTAVDEKALSVS